MSKSLHQQVIQSQIFFDPNPKANARKSQNQSSQSNLTDCKPQSSFKNLENTHNFHSIGKSKT